MPLSLSLTFNNIKIQFNITKFKTNTAIMVCMNNFYNTTNLSLFLWQSDNITVIIHVDLFTKCKYY